MQRDLLFAGKELRDELSQRRDTVRSEIEQYDADALLATPANDLAAALIDEHRIEPIVVLIDQIAQLPVEETFVDVSQDRMRMVMDRSRPAMIPGSALRFAVPFEGDPWLLTMQPGQRYLGTGVTGVIRSSEILITYTGVDPTAEQVRTFVNQQLELIQDYVGWINNDLATYGATLPQFVHDHLESRRARLLRDRGLEGAIGFPVRRRSDGPEVIPVTRKRLGLRHQPRVHESTSPYRDEFAIADAQYEEIIDIVVGMARGVERSPSTFSQLDEETLRDHFLLQLNGTFEGQAAGEVFNGAGKTDILVRVEDRNVFIGEFKIWHGEKRFTEAIDQLLSYLVWRDTKAALVLLIRQQDATAIITKADASLRAHPNFKREGRSSADPSLRRNFVLHQTGDPEREIMVAFIPVVQRP